MSTQPSSFPAVPFCITHPQQNLRLLELPPDLLELLASDGKPSTLHLKSSAQSTKKPPTGTKSKDEYLHLCTKDKVWSVRQVSTSNSVYITTPSTSLPAPRPSPAGIDVDQYQDAMAPNHPSFSSPSGGITAISQPTSSLELVPLVLTTSIIEDAVKSLVPVNDLPPRDGGSSILPSNHTIASLVAEIPYPDNILKPVLRNLFVFEIHTSSATSPGNVAAYIPSPQLLLKSWREFNNTNIEMNAPSPPDLSTFDVIDAGAILSALAADEGEEYASVARAILQRFVVIDVEEGKDDEELREDYPLEGQLNGTELTLWLGRLLVRCAVAGAEGMEMEKVKDEWTNLVPRAWWEYCDVSSLASEEYAVADGRVRWIDLHSAAPKARAVRGDGGSGQWAAATGTGTGTGKRKWHEKFAAQRDKR